MTESRESLWNQIAPHLPKDLAQWRALDIGCGTGFIAFELAKRGAFVTGIDTDTDTLTEARSALSRLGLERQVEFEQKSVYDLASDWDSFDLIVFASASPPLRYPVLALDIAARKSRRLFVFQGRPDQEMVEADALLHSAGLRVTAHTDEGAYFCVPEPQCVPTQLDEEYQAATALRARLTKTLRFRHCWVNSTLGYTETCFHDGTRVPAVPEDSERYRANAAEFGYGADTAALSREHEILHTFLAESLGLGSSPTLWAVAHGQQGNVAPIWEQEEEESWTLAFQTYLHGGPMTEPLARFTDAGLDLESLRMTARTLLK